MMIRLLAILIFAVTLSFGETKKIVVDLTTGNMENFMVRALGGIPATADYFIARGESVEVAVVIHGEAYRFFIDNLDKSPYGMETQLVANQNAIRKRLEEIVETYGVTFQICQSGMQRKGLARENVYPFVTPIKSAMIGLAEWQAKGHGYIPIP